MKKLLPAFVLALLLFQLLASPVMAYLVIGDWMQVTTQAATDITPYSAILHANLGWPPSGSNSQIRPASHVDLTDYEPSASVYFQYGTSSGALTSSTQRISVTYGQTTVAADVLSLLPCTTYYFQPVFTIYMDHTNYEPSPADALIALVSTDGAGSVSGLGVGLNRLVSGKKVDARRGDFVVRGAVLFFQTTGCVTNTGSHNASGAGLGNTGVGLSNITVQSATLSAARVAPGEKVDITATVANKGTVNGESKITLYINGEQVEAKGVAVSSGQSTPIHFSISENEPGTYNVHVGGVSAGSFTVDAFNNNDILIYGIIGLFTIGIAGTLLLLARKRQA